jgi:hypothetical protein
MVIEGVFVAYRMPHLRPEGRTFLFTGRIDPEAGRHKIPLHHKANARRGSLPERRITLMTIWLQT